MPDLSHLTQTLCGIGMGRVGKNRVRADPSLEKSSPSRAESWLPNKFRVRCRVEPSHESQIELIRWKFSCSCVVRERIQLLIFGLAGCWLILSSLYDHCWILATSKKLKYVDFSSWSKFIWLNVGQLKIFFVTSGVTIDSPSTPESQLRVRVEPSFDSPINSESEPAKNRRVRVESEPSLDSGKHSKF